LVLPKKIEIMSKERILYFDILKGTAILLVIWGHSVLSYPINFMSEGSTWHYIRNIIYSFHMPLFFIISGWTYAFSKNKKVISYRAHFFSKIKYIFFPYLVFSLLYILAEIVGSYFSIINPEGIQQGGIIFNIINTFLWLETTHFWFLYVLFCVFIVAPLFDFIFIAKYLRYLFFGALIILNHFALSIDNNLFLWKTFIFYLVFFYIGVSFFPVTEKIRRFKPKYIFMSPFLILLLFSRPNENLFITHNIIIKMFIAIIGILFALSLVYYIKEDSFIGGFLSFCGVYSLQYYLFSDFIFVIYRLLFINTIDILGGWINIIIFISTVFTNYLICRYLLSKVYLLRLISGTKF